MSTVKLITGKIIVFITSLFIVIFMADNYIVDEGFRSFTTSVRNFALLAAAFAAVLGVVTFTQLQIKEIKKRTPGRWYFNMWALILAYVTLGLYLLVPQSPSYKWLTEYWYAVPKTGLYGLTIFYLVSASFRAFKIRTKEAAVLLIAATVVVLGNAPVASVLIWDGFPALRDWILMKVASTTYRGIYIGMAAGSIGMLVRTLLGQERGYIIEAEGGSED